MNGVSGTPPAGAPPRIEAEPFVLYKDGHNRERVFRFEPGAAEATVGRGTSADLVIDWDREVSRLHARFEQGADHWTVVDEGLSTNGTFVNGKRVSRPCRLSDGDSVRFGSTTVTFHSPQDQAGAPAGAAPGVSPAPAVDLSTSQRRVLVALCRPYKDGGFATPPSDQQIAEELFLSLKLVKTHLSVLAAKFGIDELPADQQRVRLVEHAFSAGLISESDL
jgi:hypothetical protein